MAPGRPALPLPVPVQSRRAAGGHHRPGFFRAGSRFIAVAWTVAKNANVYFTDRRLAIVALAGLGRVAAFETNSGQSFPKICERVRYSWRIGLDRATLYIGVQKGIMNDDLDIRPTLHNRLKSVDAQLVRVSARRRDALMNLRRSIEQTLAQEDALRHDAGGRPVPVIHPTTSGMGLGDLLLRLLQTGPKTLEQLKSAGEGWPLLNGHNSPGRAINFTLVGLQRGGRVEQLKNEIGNWFPVKAGKEAGAPVSAGAPRQ